MDVAIIGAGTMGSGIAYVAAAAGLEVRLHDAAPDALERGLRRVDADLRGALERGKLDEEAAGLARQRVTAADSVEDAVDGADLVIEAIVEDVAAKQALFARIEPRVMGHTVLATNTSSLSITEVMATLDDSGRGIGMHFFNPVRAMRLCELVLGLETREETVLAAEDAARRLGKETVRVKDVAGFVTSRINAVIGNEALFLLGEGVASAEDIDHAVRLGLNHPMGPLEMADLVGLDVRLAVLEQLRRSLGDKYRPAPLLGQYVQAGRLGRKTGRGVFHYDAEGRRIG